MATLYITEFSSVAPGNPGHDAAAPQCPPVAEQNVAIGGASAQSAAFNSATQLIRVHTDAICSLAFGANPTAVATAHRMVAGDTAYYGVKSGTKIAVITNT